MRTIFLVGLSWNIQQMRLENKPWTEWFWTDDGRLSGDQNDPSQWHTFYSEAAILARVHGLAPVLRSNEQSVTILRDVALSFKMPDGWTTPAPTWSPFFDTGALSDVVSTPGNRVTFDTHDDSHLEKLWTVVFRPFFQLFDDSHPRLKRERTPNGRPLITWWGLRNTYDAQIGNEVLHWEGAQRMLDHVSGRMIEEGFGAPDHVVDWSWPATIQAYGMHAWFSAPATSWSTHSYQGVTVGVAVPGFRDPQDGGRQIDRRNGDTLREALAGMRAAQADYVFLESLTNIPESAGFYRSDAWNPSTLYLDIVREHIAITSPVPEPVPVYGDSMIVLTDLTDGTSKVYDNLIDNGDDTFTLIYPTPGGPTVASLQPNGDLATRLLNAPPAPPGVEFDPKVHGLGGIPKAWEKGKKRDGKFVLRTEGACKVYGLIEGV